MLKEFKNIEALVDCALDSELFLEKLLEIKKETEYKDFQSIIEYYKENRNNNLSTFEAMRKYIILLSNDFEEKIRKNKITEEEFIMIVEKTKIINSDTVYVDIFSGFEIKLELLNNILKTKERKEKFIDLNITSSSIGRIIDFLPEELPYIKQKIMDFDKFIISLYKNKENNMFIEQWNYFHDINLKEILINKITMEKNKFKPMLVLYSNIINTIPEAFNEEEKIEHFNDLMSFYENCRERTHDFKRHVLNLKCKTKRMKAMKLSELNPFLSDVLCNVVWIPYFEKRIKEEDSIKYFTISTIPLESKIYNGNDKKIDNNLIIDKVKLNELFVKSNILITNNFASWRQIKDINLKEYYIKRILNIETEKKLEKIKNNANELIGLDLFKYKIMIHFKEMLSSKNLKKIKEDFSDVFDFNEKTILNQKKGLSIIIDYIIMSDNELNVTNDDINFIIMLYKD